MMVFHGFGSANLLTTLRLGLTSPSARMGLLPDPARFRRQPSTKGNLLASLPPEIILQIIEDDILTQWDRVRLSMTCRRLHSIVYPSLYRRFDWIEAFNPACSLGLINGFGLLVEILLEPVISGFSMMFGLEPAPDPHIISFQRRADFVREMSVLGGYQYYKEMGVITRHYGSLDNGDRFISLFEPFQNLQSIEFDERAAVSWNGYLRVIANILVSKPTLEDLTLRHRMAAQWQSNTKYELPADMTTVGGILSKGVVSKLNKLTIILGRKFEPTEMGYEYFRQFMEVFDGATSEVTTFRLFASYSKLDETDPLFINNAGDGKADGSSSVRVWSFPKLRELEIHTHNFPSATALWSIEKSSLENATKLRLVCDIVNVDLDILSQNLSSFRNVEDLSIWDPQWPEAREYNDQELLPICQRLGLSLRNSIERLGCVQWTLGYQRHTTHCILKYSTNSNISTPIVSFIRKNGVPVLEKTIPSLPEPVRYLKQGYMSVR
ncbi:hypothetical protein TWF718_002457 [Orbilia javanica]|uniref:F-box domain-containing protein n=1 Tax=Orbilia javanica TaxID=47235 RepID=A0AAN8RBF9_9PEZI